MKEYRGPLAAAIFAAVLMAVPAAATAQEPAAATAQQPQQAATDHLQQAKAALNDIQTTSVTGAARTKLTQLKRHMASLEQSVANPAAAVKSPRAQRTPPSWATHLASVDKALTELTSESMKVDDATRTKLTEVRTHITAFAGAMSGSAAPAASAQQPPEPKSAPKPDTPADEKPSAAPAQTAAVKIDKEAARRHLTAARDTLSQLTQIPAAAQLSGEARTQVSQLITNFNELITTQAEWRTAYAKVAANLTAILGAERTDEANVPPPATGTAGAVGTAGVASLDPKIREKLVEFRNHLLEFERASGGSGAAPAAPAAAPPATAPPAATPPAATPPAATPPATTPPESTPPATPPATTATATAPPAQPQPQPPAQHQHPQPAPSATAGHSHEMHAAAMEHIAAIEAILNPPSTSGAAADVKLDRAQIDQLRLHLTELKKLMQQARKE